MNALANLLNMPDSDKETLGLVHTPAEIAQQPDTWHSTFELFQKRRVEISEFLLSAGINGDPHAQPAVYLIGAGTSDYIGQALANLLRKAWSCEVAAVPSTDLLTHMDDLLLPHRRYLWVSFSRSGDSPESVAVLERAYKVRPDVHHLVISCNSTGKMIRESTGRAQVLGICLEDAVNDRGLAMTSSFSNMVVFGQCLAHASDLERYRQVLRELIQAGKNLLPSAADLSALLAKRSFGKACFVGSGPLRAVARESALKLLELTAGKTLTMSESALGLRHGPMAALDEDSLFVCFLSGNERVQQYERDLLEEIGAKRLVKTRVVVAGTAMQAPCSLAEHLLTSSPSGTVADDCRAPVDVIFGQLLGLFFSLQWNLQPDCPSPNGAISRVVQSVSIHD